MKKNKSRTPVLKKMSCVFFAILSLFMLMPLQPSVVAEAVYNADYTVIMEVSGTSKALTKNKLYYSPNKTYACVFQSDGNLVVYRHRPWLWGDQVTSNNAVWKSGTNGIALNGNCYLQKDANLVVYAANGAWKFSTYHSYSNAKKVQLRLDNNGVLRVYYKTSTLGSWNLSWQSTASQMGTELKHEPDASLLVGKWVTDAITQPSGAYIIIEFAENGRLNVEFHNVDTTSWPNNCNPYFNASTFGERTGSYRPGWEMETKELLLDHAGGLYGTKYALHSNHEGTKLWLNTIKFERYEY